MTAGIAANRPMAVANKASAMPGATTASEVLLASAMAVKLRMMPQTVPNRPTKGATEPTVARMFRRSHSRSSSAATAAFIRRRQPLAGAGAVDDRGSRRAAPFVDGRR